jgi:hypothetical protein
MPEKTSEKLATNDVFMRRFREAIAALISVIIIAGTISLMVIALGYVNSPDLDPSEKFARAKDLLLFINPLLGVVVGYYFNKVTSEARAETAETAAQTALDSAQQATEARNVAQAEARSAQETTEEAKVALKEVSDAAEKMMAEAPTTGTLSADEGTGEARVELKMALKRAKRLVG